MGDSLFLLRSTIADMRKEGVVMVYGVDRTVPGERGSEVVIETASRAKAYRLKNKLQKLDPEAVYGTSMLTGSSAGEYDEGSAEGFEEYISETVRKILG